MMAFGIESRVPFVDHILVEWVAKLPASLRLSGGWSKRILREALRGILPDSIRTRRSKLGFLTPESAWLSGPLSGWLKDTLTKPRYLPEVVDVQGVVRLLSQRSSGNNSPSLESALFYLAVYESWARQFLCPLPQAEVGNVERVASYDIQ
jgi:asparagine synthase (glutamine-hydrolysing)